MNDSSVIDWLLEGDPAIRWRVHFELEPAGKPSRWVTLNCLRILRWWDAPTTAEPNSSPTTRTS